METKRGMRVGVGVEEEEENSGFSDFSDEEDQGLDGLNDSEEDEFDLSQDDVRKGKGGEQLRQDNKNLIVDTMENQPYDAKVELDQSFSDESIDTADTGTPKMRKLPKDAFEQSGTANSVESVDVRNKSPGTKESGHSPGASQKRAILGVKLESNKSVHAATERVKSKANLPSDSEGEDSSSNESETSSKANKTPPGAYKASDYEHLNVTSEQRELFQYLGRYTPHVIELDTKLRCFIPDFIPAVGQIDPFIKVPRPDRSDDRLGLTVVDEPSATQSDPTVLELQLRAVSKKTPKNPIVVRSIENAEKNKKDVENWIDSIKDLHRSKPPPQVHYTRNMPDVEALMQVWPEEVENLLKELKVPPASAELDLREYVRVVCAILDIPVYPNTCESVHVLFTLYSAFTNNPHFSSAAAEGLTGTNIHAH